MCIENESTGKYTCSHAPYTRFTSVSTTPSKSNQLRNVNTVRWESGNVTAQPWEINNRKSEFIAFVVNAGMNVTANNFYV